MPEIFLGAQAYEQGKYNLPPERLVNMYVEKLRRGYQGRVNGFQLVGAPGLKQFTEVGSGPIRAIFQEDGVLSGTTYVVSGSEVYSVTNAGVATVVGSIVGGTDIVPMAADDNQIALCSGGTGYVIDSNGLNAITDPDFPNVIDVVFVNGYFLWLRQDSDEYIWSTINDATDYDALDFATAEARRDTAVSLLTERNSPIVFGQKTIERLRTTGDDAAPFVRLAGGVLDFGCVGKDAAVSIDNTIFWVDRHDLIYRLSETPVVISTPFISEQIEKVAAHQKKDITLAPYTQRAHSFLVMHLPGVGTYVYDTGMGLWSERKTRGQDLYRPQVFFNVFGKVLAGSQYDGWLYELDEDTLLDDDQEIERNATANITTQVKRGDPVENFAVEGIKGSGVDGGGQGEDPQIMVRFSKDGGNTFSNEYWRDWGKIGKYNTRAIWRAWGDMGARGLVIEIDMSDPVKWVIDRVTINEDE